MIIKRKIGPKGQVVIPKDIREILHILPGSDVLIELVGEEIIIRAARNKEDFLENFTKTDKKLEEKIDYKKLLDEQYDR
ncbi:MAG: AbrB/MazE/SpoVT family DNA-binding domain-containing protein [Candidatus Lokiarchaeota archaeon]|nr:AbrB/MazE/SpoVT family DNA-binding domain-containing protein [Candidatus Lokiarchaeota archaeon]